MVDVFEVLLLGDILVLKLGCLCYLLLLNEVGGILDDLMVLNIGKDFVLVVNGVIKWDDIVYLCEYLFDEIMLMYLDE